jgi:multicomponent Na+:H+ antiporter subunit B
VIWQLDLLLFIVVVVLAVLALRVRNLMAAVAILSAFSLVVALMFAGMAAVDVAFVEAVLGAGLTGLLFVILIRTTGQRAEERRGRGRLVLIPLIAGFAALMVYASGGLPDRGDPSAPAHVHVSPDYLARAVPEARTPNVVTAVLADFRSIDTLGELLVIFTAGLAVLLVMSGRERRRRDEVAPGAGEDRSAPPRAGAMVGLYRGQIVRLVCVVMAPTIMMFGLYVIAHGHYGPGGGFAGGIIVGVGIILLRLTTDREQSHRWFPPVAARLAAATGALVFVLVGAAPLLTGSDFLDYAALALPGSTDADARYLGILVVELAVGVAVTGVMLTLFDTLAGVEEEP